MATARVWTLTIGGAALVTALVALAITQSAAVAQGAAGSGGGSAKKSATQPATTTAVAVRFAHANHAKRGVDVATCVTCHSIDSRGVVATPASIGHSPCNSSSCHAADFVASGAKTKASEPARWAKAAGFCLGCHASNKNEPPNPWERPRASAAFQGVGEYHVEMNHLDHTARTPCRECHAVDGVSFQLLQAAPGHKQCVVCHNGKDKVPAMSDCGTCHKTPAKAAYFTAKRKGSDVRTCEETKGKQPCFAHEHKGHRMLDDTVVVQCSSCHFMLADTASWGGHNYKTLKDIAASPLIENKRDKAHKACGGCHHHAGDVNDSAGRARCSHCHTNRVLDAIFQ